jgi:hypothetical protein
MDEISKIIGALEASAEYTAARLDRFEEKIEERIESLSKKIDALNAFKWKATGVMVGVFGVIEVLWRAISSAAEK